MNQSESPKQIDDSKTNMLKVDGKNRSSIEPNDLVNKSINLASEASMELDFD